MTATRLRRPPRVPTVLRWESRSGAVCYLFVVSKCEHTANNRPAPPPGFSMPHEVLAKNAAVEQRRTCSIAVLTLPTGETGGFGKASGMARGPVLSQWPRNATGDINGVPSIVTAR